MSLQSIIGHESAIAALRRGLTSSQLAGTYLFAGEQGIGKTSLARAFGASAACLNPQLDPFDACGRCDSCLRAVKGEQPEIVLIPPAGEQTQIWQFWDRDGRPPGILQHSLNFAPIIGRRRVYIIERAETLNEPAANSLLKALEEPPRYVVFVLLTSHTGRLLPTVLSRCQLVRLSLVPVDTISDHLAGCYSLDSARARTLAALSEGRIGRAINWARDPATMKEIDRVMDFAESIAGTPPLRALRTGEQLRSVAAAINAVVSDDQADEGGGKEKMSRGQLAILVELLIGFYRDLLSLTLSSTRPIAHEDRRDSISGIAAGSKPDRWKHNLERLLETRRMIDQNVNNKALTDWLALSLSTDGHR